MPIHSVARRASARPGEQHRAHFDTQWVWPSIAVISICGELDASNAPDLPICGQNARASGQLVLDMSGVEFFGACCFAGLHTLNVHCAGDNIDWVLIPSTAVARVVDICDPAHALPVSGDLPAALSKLRNHPRQLQLVNPGR
ncbi:STAS domain-containing protein [Mycobacterium sp. TNTM28]|uniref:STAS domain-containing protein n=1 Tax=[Mycobacterium] fortunisiensis TaxID=2600579 RepID=A0ABS6KK89_9MYCO|nr:STAS domain-containing protein [[Mycobacterium] fortunisiensis]MBU9763987.1 STAS domain-containing protein [[Mycobacterium] fortunisiensis]